MQGKWADWDAISGGDLNWQKLLHGMTDSYLKFCLNAPNNSLPTADNLRRWSNAVVSAHCTCCGAYAPTLHHVLNGCPVALHQGRFNWRHDTVLTTISNAISEFIQSLTAPPLNLISFVRAGEKPRPQQQLQNRLGSGILTRAADWELLTDTDGSLSFPSHIAVTTKRPDIVIYSPTKRIVVLIELTCPIEDNIAGAYASSKSERYKSLVQDCIANGWNTYLRPVEIGSRGYCSDTLRSCLVELGFSRPQANKAVKEASNAASRCSYLIYCRRNVKQWENPT